jgi:hypothetical protein
MRALRHPARKCVARGRRWCASRPRRDGADERRRSDRLSSISAGARDERPSPTTRAKKSGNRAKTPCFTTGQSRPLHKRETVWPFVAFRGLLRLLNETHHRTGGEAREKKSNQHAVLKSKVHAAAILRHLHHKLLGICHSSQGGRQILGRVLGNTFTSSPPHGSSRLVVSPRRAGFREVS